MKFMRFLIIGLFISNTAFAGTDANNYPKETCQEIYQAIGTFLYLADVQWKEGNEQKAIFYSTASANYASIYQAVCKK